MTHTVAVARESEVGLFRFHYREQAFDYGVRVLMKAVRVGFPCPGIPWWEQVSNLRHSLCTVSAIEG
jgi:hypothetical protein